MESPLNGKNFLLEGRSGNDDEVFPLGVDQVSKGEKKENTTAAGRTVILSLGVLE